MAAKIGDTVQVVDREVTLADTKSGLYYNHFRNMTGTVERIYDDNTVCIDVDLSALPDDVALRHGEIGNEMRDKWIDGLSQEARSKLTAQDKQFKLRYKIVLAVADVVPIKGGEKKDSAMDTAKSENKPVSTPTKRKAKPDKEQETASAKRVSTKDLDDAEQQYLESRRQETKEDEK